MILKLIATVLRRRRFISHPSAKLYSSARILNHQGRIDAISIGAHSHIRGELMTFGHGGRIDIGEYCYVGEGSRLWSGARISVGDRTLISHNVNVFDNLTHPISPHSRHQQFREIITSGHPTTIALDDEPIIIRSDVLVGCQSVILRGVTLGEGCIVGAGSIVTKNVPEYTIVAGNPARVIGEVAPDE